MIDSSLRPNGSHKRTKIPSGSAGLGLMPLGLLPVRNVSQAIRQDYKPPVFAFQKPDSDLDQPLYYNRQSAAYAQRQKVNVTLPVPESSKRQGFTIHEYRSGELTGGRFTTGLESSVSLVSRSGTLVTKSLTQKARTKIRRAIQNAEHNFKCFLTVTFSPVHLNPWECSTNGTVRHDFAKYKFKKFLHSIKVSYDRKFAASDRDSDLLAYVWVAELQKSGNIHFHALLNQRPPIKWLTKLWAQASNSIDVRSINNLNHASCYIRKYMEKEKSVIEGNRYGITQGLRESMQPEKTVINGREKQRGVFAIMQDMSDTIESNGGKVLEHGFYIPTPSRSVVFRGKDGTTKKTVAVNIGCHNYLFKKMASFCLSLPF